MSHHFDVSFPLTFAEADGFAITFTLRKGSQFRFERGMYVLEGANGVGKSTFLNMLALILGNIGPLAARQAGTIRFDGEAYDGRGFDCYRAAAIRERHFCIFPQRVFFLPVSTRDNYLMLNGSDPEQAKTFSRRQIPDRLSGGQQQRVLMEIVLDPGKPVWFLDEPLANLDVRRRLDFWRLLSQGWRQSVETLFFIDHLTTPLIRRHPDFQPVNVLRTYTENRGVDGDAEVDFGNIRLYYSRNPEPFFRYQMQAVTRRRKRGRSDEPLRLDKDWGASRADAGHKV